MKKPTILLVDDDVDFVETHKLLLEKNDYEVEVAHNGTECMKKLADGLAPDLIILDVIMNTPDEGFDVARTLKNGDKTRFIPIIMLTSVGEGFTFKYRPNETWVPVDLFLEKPVPPERLISEIRRAMGTPL